MPLRDKKKCRDKKHISRLERSAMPRVDVAVKWQFSAEERLWHGIALSSHKHTMANHNNNVSSFQIQSDNWSGCIPIVLSLAPTSLSSPSMPSSIHVLVNRQSFLHVGLQEAVMRLYKFAPMSFSSSLIKREEPTDDVVENSTTETKKKKNDSHNHDSQQQYPVCWFEDEDTQFALRWHLFVGVLWDLKSTSKKTLPWKIRLHFSQYPSSQILPMDNVLETVECFYMNSLKQALFMQYSSSKVAMSMSKQTHEQVWDAITTNNFQLYHQVNADLQQNSAQEVNLLPIRVLVNSLKPPIQRPCRIPGETMCV